MEAVSAAASITALAAVTQERSGWGEWKHQGRRRGVGLLDVGEPGRPIPPEPAEVVQAADARPTLQQLGTGRRANPVSENTRSAATVLTGGRNPRVSGDEPVLKKAACHPRISTRRPRALLACLPARSRRHWLSIGSCEPAKCGFARRRGQVKHAIGWLPGRAGKCCIRTGATSRPSGARGGRLPSLRKYGGKH